MKHIDDLQAHRSDTGDRPEPPQESELGSIEDRLRAVLRDDETIAQEIGSLPSTPTTPTEVEFLRTVKMAVARGDYDNKADSVHAPQQREISADAPKAFEARGRSALLRDATEGVSVGPAANGAHSSSTAGWRSVAASWHSVASIAAMIALCMGAAAFAYKLTSSQAQDSNAETVSQARSTVYLGGDVQEPRDNTRAPILPDVVDWSEIAPGVPGPYRVLIRTADRGHDTPGIVYEMDIPQFTCFWKCPELIRNALPQKFDVEVYVDGVLGGSERVWQRRYSRAPD